MSAAADTAARAVTVELRDESVPVEAVVKALAGAGFTSGAPVRKGGAGP